MTTKMYAYHGKFTIKRDIIKKLAQHRAADRLQQGSYGRTEYDGRIFSACGVACTVGGNNHIAYEKEFGFPEAIARIEDNLFEGMTKPSDYKSWPSRLMKAANIGADLSTVADELILQQFDRRDVAFNFKRIGAMKMHRTIRKMLYQRAHTRMTPTRYRLHEVHIDKLAREINQLRLSTPYIDEPHNVIQVHVSTLVRKFSFVYGSDRSAYYIDEVLDAVVDLGKPLDWLQRNIGSGSSWRSQSAPRVARDMLKIIKGKVGRCLTPVSQTKSMDMARPGRTWLKEDGMLPHF